LTNSLANDIIDLREWRWVASIPQDKTNIQPAFPQKGSRKMKCMDCVCWWQDEDEEYPSCHADPNWPAPCEHDDDYETEDYDDEY